MALPGKYWGFSGFFVFPPKKKVIFRGKKQIPLKKKGEGL